MFYQNDIIAHLNCAFDADAPNETPYRHWLINNCLPDDVLDATQNLPFEAPALDGVSGSREVHNKTRVYFDKENRAKFQVCDAIAETFQSDEVVAKVERTFGTNLKDTYLRIEYCQDIDGFWLQPHTDIGVKSFTFLLYLSDLPSHKSLGTDIYSNADHHVASSPFVPNLAMVFVPSDNTWHGFERRPIEQIRKTLIVNYVTQDWRAREQLAFPDKTVNSTY